MEYRDMVEKYALERLKTDIYNELKKENPEESIKYLKKNAEKGEGWAQLQLGVEHYYGELVEKDLEKSLNWTEKAHESRTCNSFSHLERVISALYLEKKGVMAEKDAEQGDAEAQFKLYIAYSRRNDSKEDLEKSAMWLEKASKQMVPFITSDAVTSLWEDI